MSTWAWVAALFAYFLIGGLLLLWLSRRDKSFVPTPDWMGVAMLLGWPFLCTHLGQSSDCRSHRAFPSRSETKRRACPQPGSRSAT